jgi:hypothetical protein
VRHSECLFSSIVSCNKFYRLVKYGNQLHRLFASITAEHCQSLPLLIFVSYTPFVWRGVGLESESDNWEFCSVTAQATKIIGGGARCRVKIHHKSKPTEEA